MIFKRKRYNYFLVLILVVSLIFVAMNNTIWINAYPDEPLKQKLVTLGRILATIGLFVGVFFIFRKFNSSITITDNEIIENKFLGESKIIPIDEITRITFSSTNDENKKMYYSPKARKRYKLLSKLDSVLFRENNNSTSLWNDIPYQSKEELESYLYMCTHLTDEEKQQIQYQKEYEKHYIKYEKSIEDFNNQTTITFSGDIPNKLRQAKQIANEVKNIKDKYKQANEQNSKLSNSHDVKGTLSSTNTVRPVINMRFPYFINDINTLEVTIVSTGEFNSVTFALDEFHNPLALYSALHSIATNTNHIRLDISDIENKIPYIPSSYRGELSHD